MKAEQALQLAPPGAREPSILQAHPSTVSAEVARRVGVSSSGIQLVEGGAARVAADLRDLRRDLVQALRPHCLELQQLKLQVRPRCVPGWRAGCPAGWLAAVGRCNGWHAGMLLRWGVCSREVWGHHRGTAPCPERLASGGWFTAPRHWLLKPPYGYLDSCLVTFESDGAQ
jgi:hypothetical protein